MIKRSMFSIFPQRSDDSIVQDDGKIYHNRSESTISNTFPNPSKIQNYNSNIY